MADDLMQLQRQAAHRVRQMQEHSRRVLEAHQGHPPPPPRSQSGGLCSPGLYQRPAASPPPGPPTPAAPGLTLPHLEEDQWLLLGLAFLLFKNGCPPELTLALLYLAL